MRGAYWVETLGCPKNQVDSDKLEGLLVAEGYAPASSAADADLVVVNTCAFIEAARQESIDTVLALADQRRDGARLVVTGCMAERYGDELASALPEVDAVAGFGIPVTLGQKTSVGVPSFDLLNLPRPRRAAPWAYVKVAEGCDRNCGFCAIPQFRGPQRSRTVASILAEVDELRGARAAESGEHRGARAAESGEHRGARAAESGEHRGARAAESGEHGVKEVVLVAQDLARYGMDEGDRRIVPLVRAVAERVERVRLLYLYPSDLTDELVDTILATGVAYFDLSLQHVSRPLLRRMRRWGDGDRFLARIDGIRRRRPDAVFRSNFIVGYPGETEDDHDALLRFLADAQLDWCGFFAYSREDGTYAATLDDAAVDGALVGDRLNELTELQDRITAERRAALVGSTIDVLVDEPGTARSWREAPEIDGVVTVPRSLPVGRVSTVTVTAAAGPDLEAA